MALPVRGHVALACAVLAALYALFAASAGRVLASPRAQRRFNFAGGFLLSAGAVSRALIEKLNGLGFIVAPKPVLNPVRGAVVLAERALLRETDRS